MSSKKAFVKREVKFGTELKTKLNMSTWLAIILTIVTAGYFTLYLQYKLTKILKNTVLHKKDLSIVERLNAQCVLIIGLGLTAAFFNLSYLLFDYKVTTLFSCLLSFSIIGLNVFWALTARKIIAIYSTEYLNIKNIPHWIFFIFFGLFAVIYNINDLENKATSK